MLSFNPEKKQKGQSNDADVHVGHRTRTRVSAGHDTGCSRLSRAASRSSPARSFMICFAVTLEVNGSVARCGTA